MTAQSDDEPWLGPPWLLVVAAATVFTAVMWSLDALVPGPGIGLSWAPVLPILAVALYALLVWAVSGDPRLWRDPTRLERLVRRQRPDWVERHEGDPALARRLQTIARHSGATAIAQQVGVVAATGAGYATLHRGPAVTVALVAIIGVAAGLLTRRLLNARERGE